MEGLVQDAIASGAKVALGGDYLVHGENYFAPTLITGVTDEMRIAQKEIFGPLAPVQKFTDEDDVIRRANRVVEALDYGMVVFSTTVAPFGSCKESGIGREGGDPAIHGGLVPVKGANDGHVAAPLCPSYS